MTKGLTALAFVSTLTAGCTIGSDADAPLSYEEFKATFITESHDDDGTVRFAYDWDQPLDGEAEVRELYEQYVAAKTGGERTEEATVNTRYGMYSTWPPHVARNLTYCVSNKFAVETKIKVLAAMSQASNAWAFASNGTVHFVYQPQYDATCSNTSPTVFDVQPGSFVYAYSFFPGQVRKDRTLKISQATFNGDWPAAGILRHELGHALGLRHETARDEAVTKYGKQCFEDIYIKPLTAYDEMSVMTTPACMGSQLKNQQITISPLDVQAIRKLYP